MLYTVTDKHSINHQLLARMETPFAYPYIAHLLSFLQACILVDDSNSLTLFFWETHDYINILTLC